MAIFQRPSLGGTSVQTPTQPAPAPAPQAVAPAPQYAPRPGIGGNGNGAARRSVFTGMGSTRPGFDSNYIRSGHYWLRVDKLKEDATRNNEGFVALEATIVAVLDNDAGKGHRVGESVTRMFMGRHDAAKAELKSLLMVLYGTNNPDDIQDAQLAEITSEAQPAKGMVLEVMLRLITTRTNTPFTKCTYTREVGAQEVLGSLSQDAVNAFFPGNFLQQQIAQQQAAGR